MIEESRSAAERFSELKDLGSEDLEPHVSLFYASSLLDLGLCSQAAAIASEALDFSSLDEEITDALRKIASNK